MSSTQRLLNSLPASVELAAGSGKTWMIADCARAISKGSGRALILTHTVAGVHALSQKLREFKVSRSSYRVATITSFAVELSAAYSKLAKFDSPEEFDADRSSEYVQGAVEVVKRKHIRKMLNASFTHLLVDEYQDCTKLHHEFVVALKCAIPETAVFGDRLQGIFGFADPIVNWDEDVLSTFPEYIHPQVPRRWESHNRALGEWLLELRTHLVEGSTIDFSQGLPNGVSFLLKSSRGSELTEAARDVPEKGESLVVITPPSPNAPRGVAKNLRGYSVMEEMAGKFMAKQLHILSGKSESAYAVWAAELAKVCFTGYGMINSAVLIKLEKGLPASRLKRPGLEKTILALDSLAADPSLTNLGKAMRAIQSAKEAQLHSREAWRDIASVIEYVAIDPSCDMQAELSRIRERTRHGGRGENLRLVSRTVLVKGLEYDHVIISDLSAISDANNLYVALSRARKSVKLIGGSSKITIKKTKGSN